MRQISNAIVYNEEWKILVVDKPKNQWKILTILPGWKVDPGETLEIALQRELNKELWIKSKVWKLLWEVQWNSPTSQITSNVSYFETELESADFRVNQEVNNPRYLTSKEILTLKTTTKLTRDIINKLIS